MSKPHFLEMSALTVNKGTALAFLGGEAWDCPEEIMAIGDSLNDIEMIQYAGIGVAMGNARPEVKKVADYITATNEEDGVAQAIEKFVLAKR
jgi:hydroxymethylpyrimidine pyrophosphatase-like HAD family hydrolase